MKQDTLMVHSLSTNTRNNAMKFSHNSIQGHHHSLLDVCRYADKRSVRWSMSVGCLLDPNSPAARYNQKSITNRPILGSGLLLSPKGNTLVISDMHLPYQHKDALDFLWELSEVYAVKRVLNVGDLYDHHRGSYHESETDALGEEQEYVKAQEGALVLAEMFPDMVITQGNHDAIPQRKLKSIGLPSSMLSDYNKLYDTPSTWRWEHEYWFDSWGSYPMTVPMVLNKRGRWDKVVPRS